MRDVSFVEAIARSLQRFMPAFRLACLLRFDQLPQCTGKVRVLENFTSLRRLAILKVDLDGGGIFEDFLGASDHARTTLTQGKSVLC